jgi:hypothetical protein
MRQVLRAAATSLPLIIIVAAILRLAAFWNYLGQHPHQALGALSFLFESGNIAASIAAGHGFSSPFRVPSGPTAWMAPVYPLVLAAIFLTFGSYTYASFVAASLLNIIFSTFTCIPIFMAGRRIAGTGVGAGAAWLWALFPNAMLIPFEAMCLTLMTTPTLLSVFPFLIGWLAWQMQKKGRTWFKETVTAIAVMVLCCLPWTIRNYLAFDAFVPLRSDLGVELWLASNEKARDLFRGEGHPISDTTQRERYLAVGEINYEHEKRSEALNYMVTHPRRELHLMYVHFLTFWSGGSPAPITDFARNASLWFRYVLSFNVLTAAGAFAGIIVLLDRADNMWLLLGVFPLIFPLPYYLTTVVPRYRQPVDPIAMLLTAMLLARLGRRRGFSPRPSCRGGL